MANPAGKASWRQSAPLSGPTGPSSEESVIRRNLRSRVGGKFELNADPVASGPPNNTTKKAELVAAYGDFIPGAQADVRLKLEAKPFVGKVHHDTLARFSHPVDVTGYLRMRARGNTFSIACIGHDFPRNLIFNRA
jgi:hypothetical protein